MIATILLFAQCVVQPYLDNCWITPKYNPSYVALSYTSSLVIVSSIGSKCIIPSFNRYTITCSVLYFIVDSINFYMLATLDIKSYILLNTTKILWCGVFNKLNQRNNELPNERVYLLVLFIIIVVACENNLNTVSFVTILQYGCANFLLAIVNFIQTSPAYKNSMTIFEAAYSVSLSYCILMLPISIVLFGIPIVNFSELHIIIPILLVNTCGCLLSSYITHTHGSIIKNITVAMASYVSIYLYQ